MIRSMTGYGRGEYSDEKYHVVVELRSVNSRYFDLQIKLPNNYLEFENVLRKRLKEDIERGKISAYVKIEALSSAELDLAVDLSLAKKYNEAARIISKNTMAKILTVDKFMDLPGIIIEVDNRDTKDALNPFIKALEMALQSLMDMKFQEGEHIHSDFLNKLTILKELHQKLIEIAPSVLKKNEEIFREKFEVLKTKLDSQRLATEIAIMYDKLDVDEEITRISSHIKKFEKELSHDIVGKKLDFILQELNREANTIASKSNDLEILDITIELKSCIEKLREQVQNIE